jgi:hypothetical protein
MQEKAFQSVQKKHDEAMMCAVKDLVHSEGITETPSQMSVEYFFLEFRVSRSLS